MGEVKVTGLPIGKPQDTVMDNGASLHGSCTVQCVEGGHIEAKSPFKVTVAITEAQGHLSVTGAIARHASGASHTEKYAPLHGDVFAVPQAFNCTL